MKTMEAALLACLGLAAVAGALEKCEGPDLSESSFQLVDPNGVALFVDDRRLYFATVRNTGTETAAEVTVSFTLSSGLEPHEILALPTGAEVSKQDGEHGLEVVVSGFEVAAGASRQVVLELVVTGDGIEPVTTVNPFRGPLGKLVERHCAEVDVYELETELGIASAEGDGPAWTLTDTAFGPCGPVGSLLTAEMTQQQEFGDAMWGNGVAPRSQRVGMYRSAAHCLFGANGEFEPDGLPLLDIASLAETPLTTEASVDALPDSDACSNVSWNPQGDNRDGGDYGTAAGACSDYPDAPCLGTALCDEPIPCLLIGVYIPAATASYCDPTPYPWTGDHYLNVAIDRNGDGTWGAHGPCDEGVVQNQVVSGGEVAATYKLPLDFPPGSFWVRATLSTETLPTDDDECWDGGNGALQCLTCGETEDGFLIHTGDPSTTELSQGDCPP